MSLRFTIRQLQYFVAVGECGSIAHASAKVNVSSPSISVAVNQLEQEFGLPLFVRKHAQGLSLTQAGRQLMEQARVVLREAETLNTMAGSISNHVQGPLAIGCLSTFAQLILPRLRLSFEERYTQVRLRQSELHQREIFDQIRTAEIDIALTYDLEIPADLVFLPLAELPPYVMVSPEHALAEAETISIEKLRGYPMVLLNLPYSSDYFLSFFNTAGFQPEIAERTRDMAVLRSLVANGFGFSMANIRPFSEVSPDGKPLRFIPLEGNMRPMKLGLVMTRGADRALTIDAFIRHCEATITTENLPGLPARATTGRERSDAD